MSPRVPVVCGRITFIAVHIPSTEEKKFTCKNAIVNTCLYQNRFISK